LFPEPSTEAPVHMYASDELGLHPLSKDASSNDAETVEHKRFCARCLLAAVPTARRAVITLPEEHLCCRLLERL